ncbi:MAG: hypothetical protein M3460_16910 [Actinomycetota bacterium]|nr:hypothetical protein [Actinomycetota bacterium]
MVTILDVIDNFFTPRREGDILSLPGKELWRLGEEVQHFAANYESPPLCEERYYGRQGLAQVS